MTAKDLILLADDHPMFLDAVSEHVRRTLPDCNLHFSNSLDEVLEAMGDVSELALVVLDFSMPGMNGVEGVKRVVERAGHVPVVVTSGVAESGDVRASIVAGAKGFVPKTLTGATYARAIQVVMEGGTYLPTDAISDIAEDVQSAVPTPVNANIPGTGDEATQQAMRDGINLTPRETEVLSGIVEGKSNKQIARELDVHEVTIKLHARSIYKKLDVKNRSQAAVMALNLQLLEHAN